MLYKINPATALKGINLLVEEGVVYKKRGVGMFVQTGAVETLRAKRKEGFYDRFVASLVAEPNGWASAGRSWQSSSTGALPRGKRRSYEHCH